MSVVTKIIEYMNKRDILKNEIYELNKQIQESAMGKYELEVKLNSLNHTLFIYNDFINTLEDIKNEQ